MKDHSTPPTNVSAEQEAIRAKCFHPLGTFVEFKKDEIKHSIPERFEKMVRLYPDRIAVKAEDRSLTYDELNQAANRIAHALLVQRGKQEEPIGLVLDHGVEAVTAILGVLKAGKMYVPLDPSFPMSRNRDVLEDSEPGLIVTDNKNFPLAVELASKKLALINIDEFRRSYPVENTDLRTAPDALAYILYTSGSTGKPKGVVQNHRNVLHLIMRHTNRAHISPDDRIAVLRSFSVHGGTLQTFGGLLNGAAILPFDTKREGVQELEHWLAREEVTLCRMGPTLFRHLAEVLGEKDHFPKLREISFSGEPLHKNDVELWRQHFSDECILVNSFGATEVSSCCEYLVDKKTRIEDGVVPCGYPTGDMEIVLLQDDGRETRFGEIGEIAVKSRYLALEYWRKPELTRAKFLPVPKGGDERIYFTGDLGRMLPDGLLVHLWRKDFQVKIRGYRVELAEVESTLLTLDNIKEAVVVGREDQALEKRLVAYVVPDRMPAPSTTTLRRALGEKLPDYMVPAVFVVLDAMPLTPNGKVDRSALSAPTGSRPDLDTPYAPPRSLIEEGLAGIWAEVLGLDHVGIHDSFLDLGGHSLAATRVTSRIYADYQVDLPLTQLFKTPTIAALADYIERLHPSNRKVKHSPIRPVSREENLTLSFSQQRLWFLSQLEPDNPVYNEPKALRIRGSLDIDNLKKALDAIVARHEVLHTIFSSIDGNPVAALNENRSVALPLIDLSERPTVHREAEVRHLLREVTHRPFNLGRDLMLRAALFRMDKEDHVLLLVVHHIASDGWSSTIFFREISALYCAFITGSPSPLPNLPIQYADFAAWQRHWLQGEVLESQLFYWKKQLEGAPAVLNLPTDRPRPIVQSFRGARQSIELSKELTQGLKALSQEEEATLFMTLLAGFLTLLHRYTGQAEMLVGSPVANRTRLELEGLIGCFINTLVLRVNVRDDPSFLELLRRVRDVCLEAYSHQDLAFEKIVEELQPQRDLSRSPLVQVMFQMRNVPKRVLRLPATEIKEMEFDHGIAKFDLALAMADAGENLTGSLEYNTDLFNDTTIERMLGNYQTLLESMVALPEQRLSEATILTADEKHQLLTRWNDTKREYPKDKCIHELFETQVEKSPDAVAVVYEDQQLTYRELNRRANQLAHYLQSLGVGPEVLVGICMERSLEMVVGLLGILKAGGAYVPLDPNYPKERLALMLEDFQAQALLTQNNLLEQLSTLPIQNPKSKIQNRTVICLDRDWEVISRQSEDKPMSGATPGNAAYVIYTSGTTGRPKGAMIEHRSVVNYLCWVNENLLGDTVQTVPAVTKPTFDASLKQLFAPLLTGREVWVLPEETAMQPAALLQAIATHAQVGLNCVPSLWTAILEAIECGQVPAPTESLTSLLVGGEQLGKELVGRSFAALPHLRLWNLYGPTEVTANASAAAITSDEDVTIGRPVANARIYILDRYLNPTPIGVPGELHISGDGLARGYLNRADMTAEKFIPDPFTAKPGARMYKSGDLARYLPDGNIECLGRIDHQVKIRGFRVEPGEIEAILNQHPAVRETVVLAREDTPGAKRLVAYVVPNRDLSPSANELRSFLKEKLPEYMVPSAFVRLEQLPLTPNGKLDRRALPPVERDNTDASTTFVAPRNTIEESLAGIWTQVLKLDKVGIHDNFFDLGGHSLLATRLISRVRDTFRLELALRSLFEAPTVAGLAKYIESVRQGATGARALPILPEPVIRDCPLSFSQERFWFLSQLEPNNLAYKITFGFHLTGPLNTKALEQSLTEIVRRHETLRTTFHLRNGEPVQVISERWSFPLTIIDLRQQTPVDSEAEVQRLFENERRRFFDLSVDLLLRATLLQLRADEHVLVLSSHHVAWDHWCIELFLRELSVLYQAFAAAKPSPLSELPIQYKHYALWQRKMFQGAELENYLAYWKEQLVDAPASLNLPADHPRQPLNNRRGGRQALVLPKELSSALGSLSKEASVTLFMTFLAAFQTLLHRMTGEDDIVVGTPVAGRDRSETEGLIGLFLNSLALRTNLSGNPTFLELLARVREVALGAYDHQELPFEKLVAELQPERDLSRTPIFQVFINMYNFKEVGLELDGLSVRPLKTPEPMPQFDLEFYIREHDDGIHLIFVYDSDLFESATIARLLGHFQILLEGVVANPEQRISELPLLTEAEKHQLLVQWNDTKREYPRDKCIHELFEEQVERTPDAAAVVFEDQQLTYRELNNRANQLAHYLQKLGVGPEVLVGICVERSVEMVVGLLGILKAGGAYVPLDSSYPKERLVFMLQDTATKLIVTHERLLEELPEQSAARVCLDRDWFEIAQESAENPQRLVTAESLAYVLYTSGSTGQPKGVAVEHRQLINYLVSIIERLDLTSQRSFATVSTLAADLGNTVVFSSLCTGAALHVIYRDRIADAEAMADYFSRHAIDCLKIVPSHLAALQSVSHRERVLPRQLLILGGEASDVEWVKRLGTLAPSCRIVNHYGPTETTVGVMTYEVEKDSLPVGLPHLPLGRPIANTQVYILDQNLNPVPISVAGELYVGGLGLARGYLNRPELTAEKFIPNPFSTEPGARLYKTGDLARYLADGNIEFLGRIDNQIKLRGYRIEPGEIEAALKQHPEVREAVILDRPGTDGEKQLAAYVVVTPDRAPTVAGKQRYRLPNGTAVAQLNRNETDYIYQEIFARQAYLRHGITIKDGDCLFDVGANIGLFTLFANQIAKRPRMYSFEPNPAVYEILKANAKLYGSDVKLFNCGLADKAKSTTFTFFPGFSLLSGFYADAQAEKEVVKTFMINQQKTGVSEMTELVEQADAILEERFTPQSFNAELRTVSSVIEQDEIECIDLLKINVEKSELDVLLGIKDSDWQKIKQIVLEVDVKDNLPTITSLLEKRGYEYVVEQDNLLEGTSLCYVYAIRPSAERRLIREQPAGTHVRALPVSDRPLISAGEMRAFLATKLPEYLIPSAFVFLDALPLTPNGKGDRQGLLALGQDHANLQEKFEAPRTPVEELLAQMWSDVLKLDKVGIHDNFFDLGGHSLLATQLISRIRDAFRLELPLRSLFETPTVAGLAEQIGSAREGEARVRALPILPEPIDEEYPLSYSQERFWFLDQLEPNNAAYKVAYGFRLTGPLNIEVLEQALSEIARRHETLRTTFHLSNDKPIQRISDPGVFRLSIVDLRQKPAVDLDAEVQGLFENEYWTPFDLSTDELLRATLVRLSTDENVLLLNAHHIAWDHWSIELFLRELSVLYQTFATAKPSPLSELPLQYKHYALWQRKMFQGAELENYLAYWKEQLVDAPASLNLPADHPRQPLNNRRGGRQALVLPKGLDSALRSLSRKAGVTFFMTLLAAFQTLLHRMTGEDDIVVGTPVAGRDRSETEGLIGLFLNSLALRTNLSGNPTFVELLARVREVALGAYDHQELPFEKLVAELQPERDLSRTPIFQVFINMYHFKEVGLELDGLTVRPLKRLGEAAPQFDLEFYIREHDDGTHLNFVYDSDLFEAATIERMLGHFQTLLKGIVANPEQRISELPLLTESEKHQLLVEWNDTKREYPRDKCIHQLFEEQVERTPEAVAVVFEDQQLTYRELNNQANQLAHYLQKLGVGPEVLVGICVERSMEMVVGLLGVLKAGGAYLPIDPDFPRARIEFMLQDSRAAFLLTQARLDELIPSFAGARIPLDRDWHEIARESTANVSQQQSPENLAYVMYTSGSTGKPKGVMIQHNSVVNFLASMAREPGLTGTDILLAVTTLSFDIAGLEIYLPLTLGARVVLARREVAVDGIRLAKQLSDCGATVMQATPATGHMLLAGGWQGSRELKILCGGEALSDDLAKQLVNRFASLWNMYGPTETTIWSAVQRVPANVGRVTLGRPIANTQFHVLDRHLKPVPVGVTGELHIGGVGLARGYLNQPELTAEKFITHSLDGEPAKRLYKTGDLARYLPDGNIEFLGRMDTQVKIRGYRIECGEIESALGQHPAVRQSVVAARDDSRGDALSSLGTAKRLVAYVVAAQSSAPSANELRVFLKQKLPEYMLPSVFVLLDSLPRTPNGKVDRRALPVPDQSRPELESLFVAPRTAVEDVLAHIWTDVLKLDKVGIHDNFFELGGHSLLATQVVSRVRHVFQMELPLRTMFEKQTVEELAMVIAKIQVEKTEGDAVANILADIESLSDEEVEELVAKETVRIRNSRAG